VASTSQTGCSVSPAGQWFDIPQPLKPPASAATAEILKFSTRLGREISPPAADEARVACEAPASKKAAMTATTSRHEARNDSTGIVSRGAAQCRVLGASGARSLKRLWLATKRPRTRPRGHSGTAPEAAGAARSGVVFTPQGEHVAAGAARRPSTGTFLPHADGSFSASLDERIFWSQIAPRCALDARPRLGRTLRGVNRLL
jgi:hypothetical protein